MSLFERERAVIVSNEFVDHFDMEEVATFIRNADQRLFISHAFKNAGKMLVQPRGGFPTYEKVFSLYEHFTDAGVDVFPLTIDSHTRLNDYNSARKMLRLSEENETDMLNGYPLVNHGYRTTRRMMTHFNTPVSLRHGTPDARLLVEIALASGIFEIEGGRSPTCCRTPRTSRWTRPFCTGSMSSRSVRTTRPRGGRSTASPSVR